MRTVLANLMSFSAGIGKSFMYGCSRSETIRLFDSLHHNNEHSLHLSMYPMQLNAQNLYLTRSRAASRQNRSGLNLREDHLYSAGQDGWMKLQQRKLESLPNSGTLEKSDGYWKARWGSIFETSASSRIDSEGNVLRCPIGRHRVVQ